MPADPSREIPPPSPSTSLSEVRTWVPAVCSECRMTYLAPLVTGQQQWICPRCRPSVATTEARKHSTHRSPWRPFIHRRVAVQIGVILTTFVLFLVLLNEYFLRHPAVARIDNRSGQQTLPMADRSSANTPSVVPTTIDDQASAESSADVTSTGDSSQPPSDRPPLPDDALTVKKLLRTAHQQLGHEIELPCQLVEILPDARGRVPNHFQVYGENIRLSAAEEAEYRRLAIVDAAGNLFRNVYLRPAGALEQEFQWVLPGDWFVLVGTPGMRVDSDTAQISWGFIVTKIRPLPDLKPTGSSSTSHPRQVGLRGVEPPRP